MAAEPDQVGRDELLAEVLRCVAETNGQLPVDDRVALRADGVLLGDGGALDSLGLINLLVSIEDRMAEHFGVQVSLVDAAVDQEQPETFATVGSLTDWLAEQR